MYKNKKYKKQIEPIKKTSWDKVANHYNRHISSKQADYHHKLIIPNILKTLQLKENEQILDIGCGQGVLCPFIYQAKSKYQGIDLSPNLINIAKNIHANKGTFYVSYAQKLSFLKDNTIDKAVSILALQNMHPLDLVFKEIARVLKPNGTFVFVLNHPCFRIPQASSWGIDAEKKVQFRRIDEYMSFKQTLIQMHPGKNPDINTLSFHRSLTDLFSIFKNTGFLVSNLEELVSHRSSDPGKTKKMEDKARNEIPMFMTISLLSVKQLK